jgi:hypothetical protein
MNRVWRHLFLVLALLFAQQAAQLHAFSHVRHALQSDPDKGAPSSTHPAAQCLAFHAVDSVLPCGKIALDPPRIEPAPPAFVALPLSRAPRIAFRSRAPPGLS